MIRHNIDRSRISGPRNNSTNHDEKGALMILTDYSGDRLKAVAVINIFQCQQIERDEDETGSDEDVLEIASRKNSYSIDHHKE
ncbi:hypothetical protein RIR_jg11535.t1 [Rhizophagus irregularis DAOM 181602=DAOM 197198]|nr:hypothetical protein RIR_jg11535.t1 [Rhizophagus irregularis DAOM 181602=DAOM 197198]CAB4382931.1 unnamed protein product [Rhizophagus irregularis]CAB5360359.1 unnamed protein product [Rhizophagus irregularis]